MGGRGILTSARIREDLETEERRALDYRAQSHWMSCGFIW
jgi:hypothetical protein